MRKLNENRSQPGKGVCTWQDMVEKVRKAARASSGEIALVFRGAETEFWKEGSEEDSGRRGMQGSRHGR